METYFNASSYRGSAATLARYIRTTLLCTGLTAGLSPSVQSQTQAPMQGNPVTASTAAFTAPAKKIRIGVLRPKVQFAQTSSNIAEAEGVRSLIAEYLSGPKFEVVPIDSMLPSQANEEAKQKQCDYVLISDLSEKAKSGSFGMLRKAMPIASMIPGVGAVAGIGGAIAAANAASTMAGVAQLSAGIKAKSEVDLEYQLLAPDNEHPILTDTLKQKAKTDGEDIITPLITQVDEAIVAAFKKTT